MWDSEHDWNEAIGEGRPRCPGSDFDMDVILESGDVFVLDVVDLVDPAGGVESRSTLPER